MCRCQSPSRWEHQKQLVPGNSCTSSEFGRKTAPPGDGARLRDHGEAHLLLDLLAWRMITSPKGLERPQVGLDGERHLPDGTQERVQECRVSIGQTTVKITEDRQKWTPTLETHEKCTPSGPLAQAHASA